MPFEKYASHTDLERTQTLLWIENKVGLLFQVIVDERTPKYREKMDKASFIVHLLSTCTKGLKT